MVKLPPPATPRRPRVNDPCPCGSGRKYKHCHGNPASVPTTATAGAPARPHPNVAPPRPNIARPNPDVPLPAITAMVAGADRARAAGRLEQAQAGYLAVLERDSRNLDALAGMALVAELAGDDDAAEHYNAALIEAHPRSPRALFVAGNYHTRRFAFPEARDCYRRALALDPASSGIWNNLGNVEKYLGDLPEAIRCYDRSVACDPDNAALHSNELISLYYDLSTSHAELFERHLAWARRHAARHYPANPHFANPREPERRLRLGYVSEGFDGRILGHFLRSVLRHHDRERFEVFGYSGTRRPDGYTTELRAAFDHWREVLPLSDDALAGQIRADAIDILVDLDGHTPDARLLVFARKPAPVQVTWLGYWNTTGMATVDHILTDPYTTPSDSPQRYTEIPLVLPDSRFCYTPVDYAPPVAPTPSLRGAPFTFGSFNRYDKLGVEVIDAWAEILRRVPGARLVIKNSALVVPYAKAVLRQRFTERGIAPERVDLRGKSPHEAMLVEYGDVDLGLDTFPYNGGLTTCEALWQGVPIVAIEQERMISRQTSAMLRVIGADEFVAADVAEYVDLAVQWAGRRERLAELRRGQRERMRVSALCDGPRFTRNLEAAFRGIWRDCCRR